MDPTPHIGSNKKISPAVCLKQNLRRPQNPLFCRTILGSVEGGGGYPPLPLWGWVLTRIGPRAYAHTWREGRHGGKPLGLSADHVLRDVPPQPIEEPLHEAGAAIPHLPRHILPQNVLPILWAHRNRAEQHRGAQHCGGADAVLRDEIR